MNSRLVSPTKQQQDAVKRYEEQYRTMVTRRMIKIVLYTLWGHFGYGAKRLRRVKEKMDEIMVGLHEYGEDFEYKIDMDFRRIGFDPFPGEEDKV